MENLINGYMKNKNALKYDKQDVYLYYLKLFNHYYIKTKKKPKDVFL